MARDLQQQPDGLKRALQERERLLVENAEWIAGRVATLLDHYYQPEQDEAVLAASTGDWVETLAGFPREVIQKACLRYIRDEPRRRPSPGAIYQIAREVMPRPKPVSVIDDDPAERARQEQIAREREDPDRAKRAAEYIRQAGIKMRMNDE